MSEIKLENIDFIINDKYILKDVTTTFQSGKITALIGPSGAGKTTLLKLINGLRSPSSGNIYIDDKAIDTFNLVALKKQIGMALQSAPMIQGTVYDNLNLPRVIFNDTLNKDDALKLLQQVNLDNISLVTDVKSLSGGQRQRLSIARTLVNKPEVLLLDEITSSLDPASVKEVEALIRQICDTFHVTIIWITHDVEQAKRITDEYCMLKDGQFVISGHSNELEMTEHEVLRAFLEGEIE
ncbi:ABC transporter ATP-binding protein [Macrococcus armenti]|uniref:ABC transporter ATP-binding protein n=1 Tax=Macrococcus armenti TaxID=2875764 RepID=UPI001CCBBF0F|nr:phosphate ABC transporter ATP-binding protein [Macrococcus armenti]UBH15992.1 phosphate ABC transporter ATP-binding protein [Macrococcus armenti]UBH18353.1 phosphate ABC transporter ATP-binding protein [Macrococcus armenti]UBH20619.1 phosphate ABC transporter ATP-binding protein [Macrococcus armenti]